MSEKDNILTVNFAEPRAPVRRTYKRGHEHTHYEIDKDRTVTCRDCGKEVDAGVVLEGLASRWGNREYELHRMRAELGRLTKEVAELKRVRRNLRAQIKRAKAKAKGVA